MTFVDHLKSVRGEDLYLEVAFGLHVIAGDLAKSIVTGADPTHVVQVQQMLGEAYGKGWKGPTGLWFRGVNRPASKYTFHPGIQTANPVLKTFTVDSGTDTITSVAHGYNDGDMIIHLPGDLPPEIAAGKIHYVRDKTADTYKVALTLGGTALNLSTNGSGTLQVYKNDPVQGIDPFFNQDTPHSNSASIRCELPNGSEVGIPDFDTKGSPPVGLTGIYECQLGDIYDDTGTVVTSNVLITNPADVLAFGCKEIRKYDNSRIDWAALETLRVFSDQLETPNYTTLPAGVGLTARYYDGSNFDTLKSRRVDPVIQYDASSGAPALDISPTSFSARFEGKIQFRYTETVTLYLTHNDGGRLWVENLSTPLIDQWGTTGEHSANFSALADQWYDIKIEWNNAAGDSQLKLEWSSTSQRREVVPQDRLFPKDEPKKRFECHAAFTGRTNFDQFLRSVLFLCNGSFQRVDGKLVFFSLDQTTPGFDFNESNIVKNSFTTYPRFSQQELLSLPNRFVAEGRDLDDRYLQRFDPPLYYDVPELQAVAGRIIEETVAVGNNTRWQALKNLAHYAKLRTSPQVAEFEGMPATMSVLQGDKVYLSHSITGWSGLECLVMEATDKSVDRSADNKIFKQLVWGDLPEPPPPPPPPPEPFNVALASNGTTATATSTLAGTSIDNTINGVRHTNNNWNGGSGTGWASDVNPSTVPQVAEYDFGTSRTISEVKLFSLANAVNYNTDPTITDSGTSYAPQDFTIDYWDGAAWVNLVTVTANDKARRDFTFSPVVTTKVRARCTSGRDGRFFIVEFEVYGY